MYLLWSGLYLFIYLCVLVYLLTIFKHIELYLFLLYLNLPYCVIWLCLSLWQYWQCNFWFLIWRLTWEQKYKLLWMWEKSWYPPLNIEHKGSKLNVYYLNSSNSNKRVEDVVKHCWVCVSDDTDKINALGFQQLMALVYGCCKHGYLHERHSHPYPLRAHAGEHEPDRPLVSWVVLQHKQTLLLIICFWVNFR